MFVECNTSARNLVSSLLGPSDSLRYETRKSGAQFLVHITSHHARPRGPQISNLHTVASPINWQPARSAASHWRVPLRCRRRCGFLAHDNKIAIGTNLANVGLDQLKLGQW